MAYTYESDHYGVAQYELTPSQFRDKQVYQALLLSLSKEIQSIEDLFREMYQLRSLPSSVGQQLDNVGTNMGVPRLLGQDDDSYRTAIYAEIFTRRSDGSANYIMNALKSIYKSPTAKIFEHNVPLTGGVVAVINQPKQIPSAVSVMKKMLAVTVQSAVILRDPTPQGYAWTPVEVDNTTSALVTENDANGNANWYITNTGLGIVVQSQGGSVVQDSIGSFGDPGFTTTHLGLDVNSRISTDAENSTIVDAKGSYNGERHLDVQKSTPVGGIFGIMAEVSQIRKGHTNVEGEQ